MELGGEEIIFLECRTEGCDVVASSDSVAAHRGIVAVHEIEIFTGASSVDEVARCSIDCVPAHVWNLEAGGRIVAETAHRCIEDAEAISITLLRVAA